MEMRAANIETDLELLAEMNYSLILDEGHRNRMSVSQLKNRMKSWLDTDYQAQLISHKNAIIGYCLWREEAEYTYIRQFYIKPEFRRRGYGKIAIAWLKANRWNSHLPLRMEVLIGNKTGISFWRSVGFEDYSITMEHKDEVQPL